MRAAQLSSGSCRRSSRLHLHPEAWNHSNDEKLEEVDDSSEFAEVVKEDESSAMVGLIPQMCGCRWGCETNAGINGRPDQRSVNPTWLEHAKKD